MNKAQARKKAIANDLTIDALRKMIANARPRGGMSRRQSAVHTRADLRHF
jgi:hypothetical protein